MSNDKLHPSHNTYISFDSSAYDERCKNCGATDHLGGWGMLADPCPIAKTFKREERYVVIKLRDLNKDKKRALHKHMQINKISSVECVVVESDWPNYEKTWQDIEDVVNGRFKR